MARFTVSYRILATDQDEARTRALGIALEQTLEIPRQAVPAGYIEDELLGRLEALEPSDDGRSWKASISYSDDDIGGDFLQFLNIVFGNSSILAGVKALSVGLSPGILELTQGPRHGLAGLRQRAGVDGGALLMSAIKPVGLSTAQLARLTGQFARGGMHYVKDDHGLVDQKNAPFAERLKACIAAVGEANAETGGKCGFVPNVTASRGRTLERAWQAQEAGAAAIMIAPAMAGMDVIHQLSTDPTFTLPIVSHPAFGGANVVAADSGFSHALYYGQLHRLMGTDAVIFPNFGGRFGFTREECISIAQAGLCDFGGLRPMISAPGGGMSIDRVDAMRQAYGEDVMYLVGGALLMAPEGVVSATRRLLEKIRG